MFAPLFPRLTEGILRDVFMQKAVAAWDYAPCKSHHGKSPAAGPHGNGSMARGCQSQHKHVAAAEDCTWCDKPDGYGDLYAKRAHAKIWEKIEPNWPMITARVWTQQATGLPYDALHRRLFLHDCTEESRWLEFRTGAGSNSSGRIVRHGLQVKPLRGRYKRVVSWRAINKAPCEHVHDVV